MMSRGLAILVLGVVALTGLGRTGDDPKNNCILNAFAARLGLTPAQKEQATKIHADFEQKAAPVCEKIWTLHCDHMQAVKQILTPEQRKAVPEVMNIERGKMLQTISTKLGL